MKAIRTINHKGYEARAISKDIFGTTCTSGYIIIPESSPFYMKANLSINSDHELSFTYARNLLTKEINWSIMFILEGLSQDKVILECKKIIDQLDEIVNNISQ